MSSTNSPRAASHQSMRREIGIRGAVLMGLGAIVGTGIYVGIAQAAQLAGGWILPAIAIAALVAALNGLSSAQLAAAHPVSGGTYEYGYRWLHPSLGFTAGWMFLCAKSASAATAALGFSSYTLAMFGVEETLLRIPMALAIVGLITAALLVGIRWSNLLNATIVSVTLTALLVFVAAGVWSMESFSTSIQDLRESSTSFLAEGWKDFLQAVALMFVAYTGYGRIATLGEEISNPQRNIPVAIITTLVISMFLYLSVAVILVTAVKAESVAILSTSYATPLEAIASQFSWSWVRYVVAIGAISSMIGVLINLELGLSRVVLAMGRRRDMPGFFAALSPTSGSPNAAVFMVGLLIGCLVLIGNVRLTWSFSAFTVLIYYAITNLAALRLSESERRYPRAFAWFGMAACLFLAFWVNRQVWLSGVTLILIGLIGWRFTRRLTQRSSDR